MLKILVIFFEDIYIYIFLSFVLAYFTLYAKKFLKNQPVGQN